MQGKGKNIFQLCKKKSDWKFSAGPKNIYLEAAAAIVPPMIAPARAPIEMATGAGAGSTTTTGAGGGGGQG